MLLLVWAQSSLLLSGVLGLDKTPADWQIVVASASYGPLMELRARCALGITMVSRVVVSWAWVRQMREA